MPDPLPVGMAAQIGRGGVWQPPTGPTRAGRVTADPSALKVVVWVIDGATWRRLDGLPRGPFRRQGARRLADRRLPGVSAGVVDAAPGHTGQSL